MFIVFVKFSKTIVECQRRLNSKFPLSVHLHVPIQRIQKYQLLLSELLKQTRASLSSSPQRDPTSSPSNKDTAPSTPAPNRQMSVDSRESVPPKPGAGAGAGGPRNSNASILSASGKMLPGGGGRGASVPLVIGSPECPTGKLVEPASTLRLPRPPVSSAPLDANPLPRLPRTSRVADGAVQPNATPFDVLPLQPTTTSTCDEQPNSGSPSSTSTSTAAISMLLNDTPEQIERARNTMLKVLRLLNDTMHQAYITGFTVRQFVPISHTDTVLANLYSTQMTNT